MEFHQTKSGHEFYNKTMKELVFELKRSNDLKEEALQIMKNEDKNKSNPAHDLLIDDLVAVAEDTHLYNQLTNEDFEHIANTNLTEIDYSDYNEQLFNILQQYIESK